MGAFASKEWSEVYNNGSPGSPDDSAATGAKEADPASLRAKGALRGDPRSISDDVERTPIAGGAAGKAQETPTGFKTRLDRFKAAIDPRSPSGVPRTPILVQQDQPDETAAAKVAADQDDDAAKPKVEDVPRRGATSVPPPIAKLDLGPDEEHDDDEEGEVEEEATEKQDKVEPSSNADDDQQAEVVKTDQEDSLPEAQETAAAEPETVLIDESVDPEEAAAAEQDEAAVPADPLGEIEDSKPEESDPKPTGVAKEVPETVAEKEESEPAQDDKEEEEIKETSDVAPDENQAAVETSTTPVKAAAASGKSLPRVVRDSEDTENLVASECRSPLLIENDDVTKNKKKSTRTPFGQKDDNAGVEETLNLMKAVTLTPEVAEAEANSPAAVVAYNSNSSNEDSLVI